MEIPEPTTHVSLLGGHYSDDCANLSQGLRQEATFTFTPHLLLSCSQSKETAAQTMEELLRAHGATLLGTSLPSTHVERRTKQARRPQMVRQCKGEGSGRRQLLLE